MRLKLISGMVIVGVLMAGTLLESKREEYINLRLESAEILLQYAELTKQVQKLSGRHREVTQEIHKLEAEFMVECDKDGKKKFQVKQGYKLVCE